jgi:hypothetical protein
VRRRRRGVAGVAGLEQERGRREADAEQREPRGDRAGAQAQQACRSGLERPRVGE